MAAGINRSREDTSQSTVTASSTQTSQSSQLKNRSFSPPRIYKPNIKPRMAQIAPRSMDISSYFDNDRKRKSDTTLLRNPASPIPTKISRIAREDNNSTEIRDILHKKNDDMFSKLPLFLSSSLEMLIKNPISSLKSRKRKL